MSKRLRRRLTRTLHSLTYSACLSRGGGVLHILAIRVYATGKGFQAIWSGIGSGYHRKLVWYRVSFNGIAHKRLKSRTIEHF